MLYGYQVEVVVVVVVVFGIRNTHVGGALVPCVCVCFGLRQRRKEEKAKYDSNTLH